MKYHEWRERTPEGDVLIFRAARHRGLWQLQSRLKADDLWRQHDPLTRDDLIKLREMLWRKYQRNRVPYQHIESLDQRLEEMAPAESPPEPAPAPPERS